MDDESKDHKFLVLFACFVTFPTIAIIGRTWSRIVATKSKFGWDDWFCMLAYITTMALCVGTFEQYRRGLGTHVANLDPKDIETILKLLYACFWLFIISVTLVKFSALSLYIRLFGRGVRGFNIAVGIGYTLSCLFQLNATVQYAIFCIPLSKFWNPTAPGWCLPQAVPWLSIAVLDAAIDLYILLLPLPMLWRLQLKLSRKISGAIALAIAYCTLIASIGRLVETVRVSFNPNKDFTWADFDLLMWCLAEPNVAVIGLCGPAWFVLIRRVKKGGALTLFHSRDIPEPSKTPDHWERPHHDDLEKVDSYAYSASAATHDSSGSLKLVPSEGSSQF